MSKKTKYTSEYFDEDTPRFIAMQYEGSKCFYIFDTVKLDFVGYSHCYHDYRECEKICDIINTVDYLLKEAQSCQNGLEQLNI